MGFIFKPVRWALGQIIIFIDWITRPEPIERTPEKQAEIDKETAAMALYQFTQCPFCVIARRHIRRLALNIESRDARNDSNWKQELINEGGQYQVPCLKISAADGSVEWMYESSDIVQYLEQRYAQ